MHIVTTTPTPAPIAQEYQDVHGANHPLNASTKTPTIAHSSLTHVYHATPSSIATDANFNRAACGAMTSDNAQKPAASCVLSPTPVQPVTTYSHQNSIDPLLFYRCPMRDHYRLYSM
jgi:hypothetical protein